jgi:hypothetical protein
LFSSDRPRRRRAVRVAWLAGAVTAAVVGTAALAGAQGAPATRSGTPAGVNSRTLVALAATGGSGRHIPRPPSKNEDYGIHFDPISTRVSKAKVRFDLPPVVFRSYLEVCVTSNSFHTPCPGHDVSHYPTLPFSYAWDVAFARNWVAVRHGSHLTFGKFPPVRVSMLAFGALPVTATAHLTQTVTHGLYDPLLLRLALDISAIPPGRHVPGFGPAPKYKHGTTFFNYRAVSTGSVNIRLSNVVVDQVPLHVSPTCRTASPAVLKLFAPAGYYPQDKKPTQLKGKPGEFQPLGGGGPAGYLQGHVDVPAFIGCHDGGDNLDPLITGMISGRGNPVNAYSPAGLQTWCSEKIAQCKKKNATAQDDLLAALRSGDLAAVQRAAAAAAAPGDSYRRPGPGHE